MQVFIGYDPREHEAAVVCEHSIRWRSEGVPVRMVAWSDPDVAEVYDRPYTLQGNQYRDDLTGAPFSTQFSFTRFLVPWLAHWDGWALFCDCDFLFRADVRELMEFADDDKALLCVQRDHEPVETVKMDGVEQTRYRRKNWSSLVLWNCGHPSNRILRPVEVNRRRGLWLHEFAWLDDTEIGVLPREWNHLVGVDRPNPEAKGVHFTLGGPWFPGFEDVEHADAWRAEQKIMRTASAA